jgi:hypothetical protein
VKLHLLHLLKGTPLVAEYERGEFELLSKERYIKLICDSLEILPPEMIIHRLTGDGPPNLLIGPMWSRKKWEVLNEIDAEMERRNSWQGKRWDGQTWDTWADWAKLDFYKLGDQIAELDTGTAVGLRPKYPVYVPHATGQPRHRLVDPDERSTP